jgi:signal transduction histidine kinase
MPQPPVKTSAPRPPRSYHAFLESRWGPRSQLLATYAAWGSVVFFFLDLVFTRSHAPPVPVGLAAAVRLPWISISALGWLAPRLWPGSARLRTLVMVLTIAWTWGNDWAYYALGLDGSVLHTVAVVLCFITAAIFMPVRPRVRLGVFALMAAGHLALDLIWPRPRPVSDRLWGDLVVLALVAVQTVVFQQFAAGQRRRFILHRQLERKVDALERSRQRADRAASDLGRLAARVAHDVNNPLAAVKVNVRWLAEPHDPAERGEVVADTLEAVDRIARSVAALEAPAVTPAPVPARRGPA